LAVGFVFESLHGLAKVLIVHQAVLLDEVLRWIQPREGDWVVDCTLGAGGHAQALLERLKPGGHLIGIDRDQKALDVARERLSKYTSSITLIKDNFRNLSQILKRFPDIKVKGILMDCGVSSLQLEDATRGFSFQKSGPLDMRMDDEGVRRAQDVLRDTSEKDLADIFYELGEERYSRRIAKAVKAAQQKGDLKDTFQLAQVIERCVPASYRRMRIHPATRSFQALRLFVNDEMASLEEGLENALDVLLPGGRMVVISFHSLEDRRVKQAFQKGSREGKGTILTKKPIRPSEMEIKKNPRSRSARLRAFLKSSEGSSE